MTGFLQRVVILSWLLLLLAGGGTVMEARTRGEFEIKAAFLYNLPSFVRWPESAFENEASPIVVGVLGNDPFGRILDHFMVGERVNGRLIEVLRLHSLDQIGACHVLFVSGSEGYRIRRILYESRKYPVLTVADWGSFAEYGGAVEMEMSGRRVQLKINQDALRVSGLEMSSKVLRIAEVMGGSRIQP